MQIIGTDVENFYMTAEEVFCDLYDKYGKALTWHMIPLSQSNGALVQKLKKEIGNNHFLYNRKIWAVVKCERNWGVTYGLSFL